MILNDLRRPSATTASAERLSRIRPFKEQWTEQARDEQKHESTQSLSQELKTRKDTLGAFGFCACRVLTEFFLNSVTQSGIQSKTNAQSIQAGVSARIAGVSVD